MSDFLLELSKNPQAKKIIQSIGLPIPMPEVLRRARGPQLARPLHDRAVAVSAPTSSPLLSSLARALAEGGANPHVDPSLLDAFGGPGEAFGRMPMPLQLSPEGARLHGLVFDATQVDTPAELAELYRFFHPLLGRLERSGRILVLGRPAQGATRVAAAAARRALEGFVRSIAKEIGKRGATANLLVVHEDADDWVAGPLRFLLSERSAYVSGQVLTVDRTARDLGVAPSWTAPLEGKVALVTGAARGIGQATAKQLAADGAKVICLDRPDDDGPTSKLARELNGDLILVDVTAEDAAETIAKHIAEKHGGVDVVVHNAGVTRDKTLKRMNPELWDLVLDVNLLAIERITTRLIEDEVLRDEGRVICLSSIAGIAGNMGQTNYAASKAGVIGLVGFLAQHLGGRGITVNAIAPGFIETRLTAAIPVAIREVGRRLNNLGQGGLPDDVAQAISFLASPGAQGLSGRVLRVCGGAMIGA